MKRTLLLLLTMALLLPALVRGQEMTFDDFYDELSPYGEWIDAGDYGYCWRPYDTDADWAPYTDGYWVYTDAGWTWVSYEDYGSITYHYGRWVRLADLGWIWRPGYEWGPAWVSWRSSDDYVGWAPLPPEVRFESSVGISVWVDRDYDIGPDYYSFCRVADFGAPVLSGVIFGRQRNVTIINQTVNITNITINKSSKVVYNGGPDYRRISRYSKRPIATLELDRRTDWRRDGGRKRLDRARPDGGKLVVYAPPVRRTEKVTAPSKVSRRIARPNVDRGWASISNQAERQRVREQMVAQTKGVTREKAPARPVDAQQVEEVIRSSRRQADQRSQPATPPAATPPRSPASEAQRRQAEARREAQQTPTPVPGERTTRQREQLDARRQQAEAQRQQSEIQRQQVERQQTQRQQIERQRQQADQRRQQVDRHRQEVDQRRERVDQVVPQNDPRRQQIERQRQQVDQRRQEVDRQRQQADQRRQQADQARQQADRARQQAERQRQQADQRRQQADQQRQQADRQRQQAESQRQQSESRRQSSERQRSGESSPSHGGRQW